MKERVGLWCSVVCLVLSPVFAGAETMYVSDHLEVAVRTGKGLEYKILAIARSNDSVEVLATDGEYAQVRLANGVEGWMLKRYLTDETPKPRVIENLEAQVEKLNTRHTDARDELARLRQEKNELNKNAQAQDKKIAALEAELVEIRTSCADFIALRDDYRQLQSRMDETLAENARLVEENTQLLKSTYLWGALAGSAFALFWFLIGIAFQSSRSRRRRSML